MNVPLFLILIQAFFFSLLQIGDGVMGVCVRGGGDGGGGNGGGG